MIAAVVVTLGLLAVANTLPEDLAEESHQNIS